MRVFVVGYPCAVGGAGTELWHTVKLWRAHGVDVTLMYDGPPLPEYRARCDSVGCETVAFADARTAGFPGVRGAVVHAFCCGRLIESAHRLWDAGARIAWANCMTFAFDNELKVFGERPIDCAVFQSEFQRDELLAAYARAGATPRSHVVTRAAMDCDEFGFAPRKRRISEPYTFGRLSRPDLDKWSIDTWPTYGKVCVDDKRAIVMGADERIRAGKLRDVPGWAEVWSVGHEPAWRFLSRLHCMLTMNGGARENWPRVGLEAMARGVPIVTERAWGWREMITDGVTGMLADSLDEMAHKCAVLAWNDDLRLRMARQARERLVDDLASPSKIMSNWEEVWRCALA